MRPQIRLLFALLVFITAGMVTAAASSDAESRVLDYIRTHLQPGQPLLVTDLYNRIFTQPEERQALDKLYKAFFRMPVFIANYQEKFKIKTDRKSVV